MTTIKSFYVYFNFLRLSSREELGRVPQFYLADPKLKMFSCCV